VPHWLRDSHKTRTKRENHSVRRFFQRQFKHQAKHFFYAAGWKKFERLWDVMIRARQLRIMTTLLEAILPRVAGSPRS
jgi:hypothetical protein